MNQSTNGETTGGIPAQTAFLDLLGKDIEANPDWLQAVDTDLVQRVQS
ncbi:hypothetical protein [Azovibrio restrictus]|nr:hypothetical protein [Azovibrio restrictus]